MTRTCCLGLPRKPLTKDELLEKLIPELELLESLLESVMDKEDECYMKIRRDRHRPLILIEVIRKVQEKE